MDNFQIADGDQPLPPDVLLALLEMEYGADAALQTQYAAAEDDEPAKQAALGKRKRSNKGKSASSGDGGDDSAPEQSNNGKNDENEEESEENKEEGSAAGPSSSGVRSNVANPLMPPPEGSRTSLRYEITQGMAKPSLYMKRPFTVAVLNGALGLPDRKTDPLSIELYWKGPSGAVRSLFTYIAFYDSLCGRLILGRQLVKELALDRGVFLLMEYFGYRPTGGGENGKDPVYCFAVAAEKEAQSAYPLSDLSDFFAATPPARLRPSLAERKGTAAAAKKPAAKEPAGGAVANRQLIPPQRGAPKHFDILIKLGQEAQRLCVKTQVLRPMLLEAMDEQYPLRRVVNLELTSGAEADAWKTTTTLVSYSSSRVAWLGSGQDLCKRLGLKRRDFLRLTYRGYRASGGGDSGTEKVHCFFASKKGDGDEAGAGTSEPGNNDTSPGVLADAINTSEEEVLASSSSSSDSSSSSSSDSSSSSSGISDDSSSSDDGGESPLDLVEDEEGGDVQIV